MKNKLMIRTVLAMERGRKNTVQPLNKVGRRSRRTPRRNRAARVRSLDPGLSFKTDALDDSGGHPIHFFGSYSINLPTLAQKLVYFFPALLEHVKAAAATRR
ncbi:hypothetical protein Y032_0044g1087 [Ancylostoma ceylanicum]|uniref:Uncharacterized protein n=1 Tax=Ancylostoma ceylanicum TaxID=53326 RepID=A0A016UD78_9BILA|nr:hypothetical protein Y032_0044g1087 [Ancylostoma ceylanicum]